MIFQIRSLTMTVVVAAMCFTLAGCQKDAADTKGARRTKTGEKASASSGEGNAKADTDASNAANSSDAAAAAASDETQTSKRPERRASAVTPIEPAKLEPAAMPKVVLTEGHAATSLIKVGDMLPDAELADSDGKPQTLSSLLGDKLTVVAFWTSGHRYSVEELADLSRLVAAPYSGYGVNVVAINEQDSAEQAKQVAADSQVIFPILLDDSGKLMSQVATEKLPRTYLVDAEGKVLWFDLEYSRTTRRDLLSAIRSQLTTP